MRSGGPNQPFTHRCGQCHHEGPLRVVFSARDSLGTEEMEDELRPSGEAIRAYGVRVLV